MNQYKFKSGFNVKLFLIVLFVVLLISYGIFNARNLIAGPIVEIFSPAKDTETETNIVEIRGKAQNVSFISLNEKQIFVDKDGLFDEKLLLSPGSNIIEIKARDRFRKEVLETLNVYYKQSTTTNALSRNN